MHDTFFVINRTTGHMRAEHIRFTRSHSISGWSFNGRYLAWLAGPIDSAGRPTLWLRDLATGRTDLIARGVDSGPSMSDRVLVWQGQLGGTVEAHDLRTGRHYTLINTPNATVAMLVGVGPGNQVAWEEQFAERDNIDLVVATVL